MTRSDWRDDAECLNVEACECCDRPMVRHRAGRDDREWLHAAHGLCHSCYRGTLRRARCAHDVDDVVVERVLAGVGAVTTHAERAVVVRHGLERGWTSQRTAELLGLNERSVLRYRKRLRQLMEG
jgi:hypothetical protein